MTAGDVAFQRQLTYVREHSPFYRDKLAGIRAETLADLPTLPFTTKDEIRESLAAEPPLGRHLAAPARARPAHLLDERHHRRPVLHRGHRRRPRGVDGDRRALVRRNRHRARPARRPHLQLRPVRRGRGARRWSGIGATVIPVGSGNTERLVKAFQRLGAEALGCTPSYALYLAEWCRERGLDPRELGVRVLSVAGEPGGGEDATRHAIEAAFGATVREAMGIADASPSLWGECEEQAGMHFCGDPYIYPELIDPETDEPLPFADGAEGELVYTTLIREAMPVLRFRSRDLVVVNAKPCPCGRGALRVRCIGRVDDLLIVRGVNLFPTAVREVVAEFRPRVGGPVLIRPAHAGVRQDAPPRVLVELAEEGAADQKLANAIGQAIRNRLVVTAEVELVPYGTLPRSEYKSKLVDFSESATRGDVKR